MSDGLAAATSPAAAFARDGYFVVRDVLDQDTIAALRRDSGRRAAGQDLEQDSTVWVHSTRELPLYATARMDAAAYLELRAQGGATEQAAATASSALADAGSACPLIAQALLRTLPSVAAAVTGWGQGVCGQGGWRLFNEHYVVKPAYGGQHFLWHRDADRHLRCAERVAPPPAAPGEEPEQEPEQEPEEPEEPVEGRFYAGAPPSAAVAYVNTWAPLDACDASNGTLCLLPARTPGHRDSAAPAARPCSLDGCERAHGVAMALQPGDVCCFSSYIFHTSRPNSSAAARCATPPHTDTDTEPEPEPEPAPAPEPDPEPESLSPRLRLSPRLSLSLTRRLHGAPSPKTKADPPAGVCTTPRGRSARCAGGARRAGKSSARWRVGPPWRRPADATSCSAHSWRRATRPPPPPPPQPPPPAQHARVRR